eukprot:CAMPEP_0201518202 /NCGR_PEP_ID=MMETSP0161_2-20130828/9108_1 /ASSEMBLY_ACC=CAM_ASM_000251 /TAXON_ID=180227 /ORGANISM="Neoparamoeba aestuarina, Strain SoJaBio B1-5/56/2" /LENGTH=490 /DNA_ID=CAMNT_0047915909 /DNA_START=3 /DNA_END=1475 /DNA_ORIENTATION=+
MAAEGEEVFYLSNFINNEFEPPQNDEWLDNFEPSTGKVYSKIPNSGEADVNKAVEKAHEAFPAWAALSPQERSSWMIKLADALEKNLTKFAEAESRDQGKPVWLATRIDIPRAVYNLRFFATSILHHTSTSTMVHGPVKAVNYVVSKPVGVACLISPWNLPLYLLTWKIAPCIATGNTCVCKPSEMTSLTAFMLCDLIKEIGFPKGVINMVFGEGRTAGQALTTHPLTPLISFTGGTVTSEKIIAASAEYKKKLSLELGGKNPVVIFNDANLEKCLETTLRSSFTNQGEICLCGSRIFVQSGIYDEFVKRFTELAKTFTVGDPKDPNTKMGALISKAHLEKVEEYVKIAINDGATLKCGGSRPNLEGRCSGGYFLQPTVLEGIPQDCRAQTEEIFGPVVTISKFETEEEGVKMATNTKYGLAAVVWTENLGRANRVAMEIGAGTVWVNCWLVRDLRMPFGGGKESGVGREGQEDSLEFFCEKTVVCLALE